MYALLKKMAGELLKENHRYTIRNERGKLLTEFVEGVELYIMNYIKKKRHRENGYIEV